MFKAIETGIPQPSNVMPTNLVKCMNCSVMVPCEQIRQHVARHNLGQPVAESGPFNCFSNSKEDEFRPDPFGGYLIEEVEGIPVNIDPQTVQIRDNLRAVSGVQTKQKQIRQAPNGYRFNEPQSNPYKPSTLAQKQKVSVPFEEYEVEPSGVQRESYYKVFQRGSRIIRSRDGVEEELKGERRQFYLKKLTQPTIPKEPPKLNAEDQDFLSEFAVKGRKNLPKVPSCSVESTTQNVYQLDKIVTSKEKPAQRTLEPRDKQASLAASRREELLRKRTYLFDRLHPERQREETQDLTQSEVTWKLARLPGEIAIDKINDQRNVQVTSKQYEGGVSQVRQSKQLFRTDTFYEQVVDEEIVYVHYPKRQRESAQEVREPAKDFDRQVSYRMKIFPEIEEGFEQESEVETKMDDGRDIAERLVQYERFQMLKEKARLSDEPSRDYYQQQQRFQPNAAVKFHVDSFISQPEQFNIEPRPQLERLQRNHPPRPNFYYTRQAYHERELSVCSDDQCSCYGGGRSRIGQGHGQGHGGHGQGGAEGGVYHCADCRMQIRVGPNGERETLDLPAREKTRQQGSIGGFGAMFGAGEIKMETVSSHYESGSEFKLNRIAKKSASEKQPMSRNNFYSHFNNEAERIHQSPEELQEGFFGEETADYYTQYKRSRQSKQGGDRETMMRRMIPEFDHSRWEGIWSSMRSSRKLKDSFWNYLHDAIHCGVRSEEQWRQYLRETKA